jgi:hypothetical protein
VFAFAFVLFINWLRKKLVTREQLSVIGDRDTEMWVNIGVIVVVSVFVSLANWALRKFYWLF